MTFAAVEAPLLSNEVGKAALGVLLSVIVTGEVEMYLGTGAGKVDHTRACDAYELT